MFTVLIVYRHIMLRYVHVKNKTKQKKAHKAEVIIARYCVHDNSWTRQVKGNTGIKTPDKRDVIKDFVAT